MHVTVRLKRTGGKDAAYDHNFHLGSAVYTLLKENGDGAAEALHESHYRSAYVLSEIHRVGGKPGEAWFRVGSSNKAVIQAIAKALPVSKIIPIKNRDWKSEYTVTGHLMKDPIIRPGEFVTLSPILLRDKEAGKSIVYDTPNYRETLEAAMNLQVRNYMKVEGTVKVIHFEPSGSDEAHGVRKRTIKERTVLAQKGRMLLDGPEEQLRFLVDHGVGLSPALGFGMVVGVNDWPDYCDDLQQYHRGG